MELNPNLIYPIIHSNGTSGSDLREQYRKAYSAVSKAVEALHQIDTNGRDYYCHPLGTAALGKALEQARKRVEQLDAVGQELMDLAVHCDKYAKD
jgi:hypothetical protein